MIATKNSKIFQKKIPSKYFFILSIISTEFLMHLHSILPHNMVILYGLPYAKVISKCNIKNISGNMQMPFHAALAIQEINTNGSHPRAEPCTTEFLAIALFKSAEN